MATGKEPYAGNPHVRFDEGVVASAATPRRGSLLYKRIACVVAMNALAVAAIATLSAEAATLTWTGAANNNLWCDVDNWDAGGEAIDFTAVNDYVFNDLPDGTTLTVASAIKFRKLTMLTNAVSNATWTFTGPGNVRASGSPRDIVVPERCTLNLDVAASNPWNSENTYNLKGGGTVRHTKSWTTWCGTYMVTGDSTLIFGPSSGGFDYSNIILTNNATLKLEKDTTIGRFWSFLPGSSTVDMNGYNLTYNFGATYGTCDLRSDLIGAGTATFRLTGESTLRIRKSPTFNGIYDIQNAWLNMGDSSAPTVLPSDSTVLIRAGGKLNLLTSQTLSAIGGTAATGAIDIPANETLTVTGTNGVKSASTYTARITGAGGLVKRGADYTLTLTGVNTYSGPTRVEEGTLELKRDCAYDDDIAYHFKLDRDGFLKDTVRGKTLSTANGPVQSLGDGAVGDCVTLDKTSKQRLYLETANTGALSNRSYTISMWIRPTAAADGTLFCWGAGWNGTGSEYRLAHLNVASDTRLGGHGGLSATAPAGTRLMDGAWHHVVFTQESNIKSAWIDGVLCGTYAATNTCVTDRNNIQFGGVDTWGYYSGSFDEIILANGVWSQDRIRRETARCRAANEPANAAARLPQPVAKWTFDEDFNDSVGGIALVSRGTGTPTLKHDSGDGAYGKYVRLANNAALGLAEGADFPESIPTGRMPFTVSIRYRHASSEYRHAFGWGDTATGNKFFAIGITSTIRCNSLNWSNLGAGATVTLSDANTSEARSAECWEHIVATYDGTTIKAYRDGVLALAYTLGSSTTLDLKPQDLYFGYRPNKNYYCTCDIDDVRVWNSALDAAQVRTLAQSLETGVVGPTLPAASSVSVAAEAVLKVTGTGHEVGALSVSGTLDVDSFSSLRLNGATTISGDIIGNGALILPSSVDLSSASADGFAGEIRAEGGAVTLNGTFTNGLLAVASGATVTGGAQRTLVADGYAVETDKDGTGLPAVSGTGTTVIPATGSVTFSSLPPAREYVLMESGSFEAPADFSGWTVSGTGYPAKFVVDGGRFLLRLNGGATIIFR